MSHDDDDDHDRLVQFELDTKVTSYSHDRIDSFIHTRLDKVVSNKIIYKVARSLTYFTYNRLFVQVTLYLSDLVTRLWYANCFSENCCFIHK